jgi:DNA-binding NarL/FixJ family response regulator
LLLEQSEPNEYEDGAGRVHLRIGGLLIVVTPVRIVVAEDHAELREVLCEQFQLEPDIEIIGQARDGWEAIAAVGRLTPDILTLDVDLPGLNGLDVLSLVRWYSPTTKVIMLSGQDDEETIREALRRGAQGYVVKGSRTDLGKAIRAVHRGEVWAKRRVLATVIEEMVRLAALTFSSTESKPALA